MLALILRVGYYVSATHGRADHHVLAFEHGCVRKPGKYFAGLRRGKNFSTPDQNTTPLPARSITTL